MRPPVSAKRLTSSQRAPASGLPSKPSAGTNDNRPRPPYVRGVNTRRQFLIQAPLSLLSAAAACSGDTQKPGTPPVTSNPSTTAGAPPAFGTAPLTGPEVSPQTFAEAAKLAQVTLTPAEQQMAADSWRRTMASYIERRTGPRKVALEDTMAPATIWNPGFVGTPAAPTRDRFVR